MGDLSHISEESIIEKAIEGEEEALRYLLETYKAFAFTIAFKIVKNREDAEEIVQDGFIKAFRALRSFKRSGKFSTWLYKIMYHTALTRIRGNKILLSPIDESFDEKLSELKDDQDGFVRLKKEDQKLYLQMAIARLTQSENVLITLYYTCELSISEVAEITGLNPSTIKVKVYRARKKLYGILSELLQNEMNDLL